MNRALPGLVLAQLLVVLLAVSARAADCPDKWNAPKDIVGSGASKEAAVADFEKKAKETQKESHCGENKCAKDKGSCRAMRTATQSCSGDDKAGWKCSGTVRVGCFCLGGKEIGKLAPRAATPPTPGEAECSNKFDDPKDVIGASDANENTAKTLHDGKLTRFIDDALAQCAQQKCAAEKHSCRLFYTTTNPKCGGGEDPHFRGWTCTSEFRAGCFCLGNDEASLSAH